jgi:pimeloyl-ACP methyl ester carboxylesterase
MILISLIMIKHKLLIALVANLLMFSFISCNVYKLAEKHIGKKMDAASLQLYKEVIKGDSVEYWDTKTDKPVMLLIHGFGASTKYQWYNQVEYLSEKYRVIMPNLLYFGTTRPENPRYEISDQVTLVNNLMNHLGINKYTVCGVSYGGLITMELAVQNQDKIEKVIAFDAPVKFIQASDIVSVKNKFEVETIEELFAPSNPKGLKKLLYLATIKKSIVPASWLQEFYDDLYGVDLEHKRKLMTHLLAKTEEYTSHEYKLHMPVLLIWGSNDPVVPVRTGILLKEHIGENAQLEIIKNGAHMPSMAKKKKFDKIVKSFLEIN